MLKRLFKSTSDFNTDTANTSKHNSADDFAKEYNERVSKRTKIKLKRDSEKHRDKRTEKRGTVRVIGFMSLPDKGFGIDGLITEASKGGFTFRPASNYLEERTGEYIQIIIDEFQLSGIIRSTRPDGYGVQLLQPLDDQELIQLKRKTVKLVRT